MRPNRSRHTKLRDAASMRLAIEPTESLLQYRVPQNLKDYKRIDDATVATKNSSQNYPVERVSLPGRNIQVRKADIDSRYHSMNLYIASRSGKRSNTDLRLDILQAAVANEVVRPSMVGKVAPVVPMNPIRREWRRDNGTLRLADIPNHYDTNESKVLAQGSLYAEVGRSPDGDALKFVSLDKYTGAEYGRKKLTDTAVYRKKHLPLNDARLAAAAFVPQILLGDMDGRGFNILIRKDGEKLHRIDLGNALSDMFSHNTDPEHRSVQFHIGSLQQMSNNNCYKIGLPATLYALDSALSPYLNVQSDSGTSSHPGAIRINHHEIEMAVVRGIYQYALTAKFNVRQAMKEAEYIRNSDSIIKQCKAEIALEDALDKKYGFIPDDKKVYTLRLQAKLQRRQIAEAIRIGTRDICVTRPDGSKAKEVSSRGLVVEHVGEFDVRALNHNIRIAAAHLRPLMIQEMRDWIKTCVTVVARRDLLVGDAKVTGNSINGMSRTFPEYESVKPYSLAPNILSNFPPCISANDVARVLLGRIKKIESNKGLKDNHANEWKEVFDCALSALIVADSSKRASYAQHKRYDADDLLQCMKKTKIIFEEAKRLEKLSGTPVWTIYKQCVHRITAFVESGQVAQPDTIPLESTCEFVVHDRCINWHLNIGKQLSKLGIMDIQRDTEVINKLAIHKLEHVVQDKGMHKAWLEKAKDLAMRGSPGSMLQLTDIPKLNPNRPIAGH